MYREHVFVEHCDCGAAALGPCASCHRARCDMHLEAGLCGRCTQAIDRELVVRERLYYRIANGVFTTIAVTSALTHLLVPFVLSIPVGFATYLALRLGVRRRVIKQMGPALAASRGELLPEPGPVDLERNPDHPGV